MGSYPYYSQPTIASLQAKSEQSQKRARAKGKTLEPVVITGRTIAKSWWGAAWCSNLERYADYESRLPRGKRYVRAGAVIDLQINQGLILGRVQGSRRTPYKVEVHIDPLPEEVCQNIVNRCGRKLETLEELVDGNFPKDMKELFQGSGGLFPTPREIHISCSCPDWAVMCKHVAAVLYGVGARLDTDPSLFFELRGIDMKDFIKETVASRVEAMLKKAEQHSSREVPEDRINDLFGIF